MNKFSLVLLAVLSVCSRPPKDLPQITLLEATPISFKDGAALWPVLKVYNQDHLAAIAMPLGGIGTGTVSLGGRGDLCDWEIMNRPAKGFIPQPAPFFALRCQQKHHKPILRLLEGPLEVSEYEGSHGSIAANHGYPRFRNCRFEAAYPLGQIHLSDPDVPLEIQLQAFNPMIPADPSSSGIPLAVLRYVLKNRSAQPIAFSICGTLPNFIGDDGSQVLRDWKGDPVAPGGKANHNEFRLGENVSGIFMTSAGVEPQAAQWGSIALTTLEKNKLSHRTAWLQKGWGSSALDFWDDFSDGVLEERPQQGQNTPMASLAISDSLPANESRAITFLIAWHFPNRYTWTPAQKDVFTTEDRIGNWYATQYRDAWDVAESASKQLDKLEAETVGFVQTLLASDLPSKIKEAALFNLSTLRTQTCFRTADGRFYGWEGSSNRAGCCFGSCTHVWNYEPATAHFYGSLARSMREVEFAYATDAQGLMSFRVHLPLDWAQRFGKAAADGQMGCIMKVFREWQLSGDDDFLRSLWPNVKKALTFCWSPGGWDADRDGVMEGCQHNTMDVEYYGINPQMGGWYLGALRAAEQMAHHLGEAAFADTCRNLFQRGSAFLDATLFNGEYYEHHVVPPQQASDVAPSLLVGMGAKDPTKPEYQLASGCLVDQLVGQYMAHLCGLGYLLDSTHVGKTYQSIMKYNYQASLAGHLNCMRSFALADESALLMAAYPKDRPENPFPYFQEVMTGFEYTAAVGMLQEGQIAAGLQCISDIRARYDGRKRNPFDEAECGHHYARAMASWAAVLALTGFHYSGVTQTLTLAKNSGNFFWSNGYAYGSCKITLKRPGADVELTVWHGELPLRCFVLQGWGKNAFDEVMQLRRGEKLSFRVQKYRS